MQRNVAIKLLHPHQNHDSAHQRFLSEARAAAALDHPALCAVHDFGAHEGRFFLVMSLIDGSTLSSLIASPNELPLAWCVETIATIADAMAVAHAAGILHLDIKPDNILVRRVDRRPVLTDFGLAGMARSPMPQSYAGTPAYMSPEQSGRHASPIGKASDIYSLGATLYELITGRLPIEGTLDDVLARLIDPTFVPPPPSKLNVNIPESLSRFCLRMMSKNVADRPVNMTAVAEGLRSSFSRANVGFNQSACRPSSVNHVNAALPLNRSPTPPPRLNRPNSPHSALPLPVTNQPIIDLRRDEIDRGIQRRQRRNRETVSLLIGLGFAVLAVTIIGVAALIVPTKPDIVPANQETASDEDSSQSVTQFDLPLAPTRPSILPNTP